MILVDANNLLYADDSTCQEHDLCRGWLEQTLHDGETVAFSWPVLLAFLRISTDRRVYAKPRTWPEVQRILSDLLSHPAVVVLAPGSGHWRTLERMLAAAARLGPLVMDAHLAALAAEHDADLCTNDRDFARFPGLRLYKMIGNCFRVQGPGRGT